MKSQPRTGRLWWVLGMFLLVGTALGTGFMLSSGAGVGSNPSPTTPEPAKLVAPGNIVCIGLGDLEKGIVNLYPVQQGRVIFVAEENSVVTKGSVLLKLDDRLAKFRALEAKADLEAAKEQVRQAEQGPKAHELKVKQQKSAVEAAEGMKKVADQELAIKKDAYEKKFIAEQVYKGAIEAVNLTEFKVSSEQDKLSELKLFDPYVDLNRAQADKAAKEARLEMAQLVLQECSMLAPEDGVVLRVYSREGEILGPNPKTPAIQFAPKSPKIVRAEVLQEWASKVREGQDVVIQDDAFAGPTWQGKVKRVAQWMGDKRQRIFEPFMVNDTRTLECIIEVAKEDHQPLLIGQRVRVIIKQDK